MSGDNIPIGGEFWFQKEIQDKDVNNQFDENSVSLNGGMSAVRFILKEIDFKHDEYLLIPSYLCPSIVRIISMADVKYKFYDVRENLSIDRESINKLINKYKVRAVFFIDYFGFFHGKEVRDFLMNLKKKKIIVIEDAVQVFWINKNEKFIGDYVFNSYRKFLPIDGSIVLGCRRKAVYKEENDNYFFMINRARKYKSSLIVNGCGNEEEMLKLFENAKSAYYKRNYIYGMNKMNISFLKKVPQERLISKRRTNYEYLFKVLKDDQEIKIIYGIEDIQSNIPLGMPILLADRDEIRNSLKQFKIYAPVHWNLYDEILKQKNKSFIKDHPQSLVISQKILTLPIDWRYDINDMKYLAEKLLYLVHNKL